MLCVEVLANSPLKEAKLTKHVKHVDENHSFFKSKKLQVKRSRNDCPAIWGGVAYSHCKAVLASFAVAWKIARAKAPNTAGENLIKPAAVEMAKIMCGDVVANNLAMVPLPNNTAKRRIQEILVDVLQQTIGAVKLSGKFSLQLDETTDISNDAQLMVFVRYRTSEDYEEQFLLCRPLTKNTT